MDPGSLERLIERFGLWLSFHPFNREDYLTIDRHWATALDGTGNGVAEGGEDDWERVRVQAVQWALYRGPRSERSACQFARDWVGRKRLGETN